MPNRYRLSRADLVRLPRPSPRAHGRFFSLSHTKTALFDGPKIVCVVSKKIAVRATDRNKIRRRCREALKMFLPDIKEPVALIFVAKREVVAATFDEIRNDVQKLLGRIAQDRG